MFGRKRRPLLDVIKYEGPQDVLVWKHPAEDFNTKSQLIVNESQTAIFYRDGQALDAFPSGRYTLTTQNYPFLRGLLGVATGGVSAFSCKVYFINKAVSMGIDWGTDMPIEMMDPEYNVPISLTAYGDFFLQVADERRLLTTVVGTVKSYAQEDIKRYFRELLAVYFRDCIANTMESEGIGGKRVNTKLIALSRSLRQQLDEEFREYGLTINRFNVSLITVKGLEEVGKAIRARKVDIITESGKAEVSSIQANAQAERMKALGNAENALKLDRGLIEAQIGQAKGITEAQRQAFEAAKILAGNTGPNVTAKKGANVSSPAGMASDIVRTAMASTGNAGVQSVPVNDLRGRLQEAKDFLDKGLIDEDEYRKMKADILGSK